jgi:hypothetical protein
MIKTMLRIFLHRDLGTFKEITNTLGNGRVTTWTILELVHLLWKAIKVIDLRKKRKGKEKKGKERKGKEKKGKERKGKRRKKRKGKERKGKKRKEKERKGKERKGKEEGSVGRISQGKTEEASLLYLRWVWICIDPDIMISLPMSRDNHNCLQLGMLPFNLIPK